MDFRPENNEEAKMANTTALSAIGHFFRRGQFPEMNINHYVNGFTAFCQGVLQPGKYAGRNGSEIKQIQPIIAPKNSVTKTRESPRIAEIEETLLKALQKEEFHVPQTC